MPEGKSEFKMAREGRVGKISITGPIGWDYWDEGMSYASFSRQLEDLGEVNVLEIEINSPGGIVTDGVAMVNALREHPASVHTYNMGEAGSMASVLLLSADRAFVPDNSMTFIHKPLSATWGNADEMRKTADELDKFEKALSSAYMSSFNGTEEELTALIAEETWYTADEIASKFSNVTVVSSGGQQAAATSEPLEILGDLGMPKESFIDRTVNALRKKTQANNQPEEVDMPLTPEEKQEIVDAVSTETASVVAEALKAAGITGKKEPAPAEPKEPEAIAFEGDSSDEEAVQAHLDALNQAQLEKSVNWGDPKSVAAYQEAKFGKKDTPPANTASPEGVRGRSDNGKLSEEQAAAKSGELLARRNGGKK